ncbi:MAG: dienelactone hydrolase family protein, partial [Caulobacteraceae bacterium]
MAETIRLNSKVDDAEFGAYHAAPTGRRRGGVVVIQEIFGIDQYVRADVERWAALGFEAIAPSMFDRFEPGFEAGHDADGFAEGRKYAQANTLENALDDIQTCVDFLKARGPVFIVGYCYGGSLVWQSAAKLHDLAAGAAYYG